MDNRSEWLSQGQNIVAMSLPGRGSAEGMAVHPSGTPGSNPVNASQASQGMVRIQEGKLGLQ
jgi:hypothetical protein